jgi:hypothetical protein
MTSTMATSSPQGPWSFTTRGEPNISFQPLSLTPTANIPYNPLKHSFIPLSGRSCTTPRPTQNPRNLNPSASSVPRRCATNVPRSWVRFGRRKCPGRHLALEIAWISIASMLAAFDFLPATDATAALLLHPRRSSSCGSLVSSHPSALCFSSFSPATRFLLLR